MTDPTLSSAHLFERAFLPLYPPSLQARLTELRSEQPEPCDHDPALARIDEIADAFAAMAPDALGLLPKAIDGSDVSVHKIGAALTRDKRDALLAANSAQTPSLPLLSLVVIHGTLYLGRCIVRNHAGRWLVRQPLWESTVLLDTQLGSCEIALFQWWLKSLADEQIDRLPLGARYRNHVEVPCLDPETLPVVSAPVPIPRIGYPSREQLAAHLAQHAPSIQGLGDDFPSPERFAELQLDWVNFLWLGEGRLLLLHAPGHHGGTHLFWLNQHGFQKAAFFPSDAAPTHIVRVEGPWLRVIVSISRTTRTHEMPWWGP